MIQPINLDILEQLTAQLERQGVGYGLGAKAPENPFFKKPDAPLGSIDEIDCSGFARLGLFRASGGKILIPDGSQMQREWCEKKEAAGEIRQVAYRDAARYMTEKRLFIAFIKPWTNGCGKVGHVWLLSSENGKAQTMESHGGKTGVDRRDWDTRVLIREVFSCFELPTLQGAK